MPASFLHGVEITEYNLGPVPIQVVNSAVIGLVGSAPLFAVSGATQVWDPSQLVQAQPQWSAAKAQVVGDLIEGLRQVLVGTRRQTEPRVVGDVQPPARPQAASRNRLRIHRRASRDRRMRGLRG